jgi:hypothetical protein
MRTRQKVTAVGALALAGAAIGGGALFTSHAMAAGSEPLTGTLIIVSRSAGSTEAIKCIYHDVDLPAAPPGDSKLVTGVGGVGGPGGVPESGARIVTGGSPAGGAVDSNGPSTVIEGRIAVNAGGSGGPPSFDAKGAPPEGQGLTPPVFLDDQDARTGTDAECAALRPDITPP